MEQSLYDKIKELYEENPKLIDRYNNHCYDHTKLSTDMENIRNVALTKYSIQQLEQLTHTKDKNRNEITHSLSKLWAFLPPKIVFDEFGEQALFWTWNRYNVGIERSIMILDHYAMMTGKDAKLLENARLGMWRIKYNTDCEDINMMYRFFTEMESKLSEINLEKVLLDASPNRERLSKIINKYSLQKLLVQELNDKGRGFDRNHEQIYSGTLKHDKNRLSIIYMDTPIGIALAYEDKPIAITTFLPENGVLEIHQIQGIKEVVLDREGDLIKKLRTKGLFDFDWKKSLVTIAEEAAKSFGIERCCIKSAKNNRWIKIFNKNGETHLKLKDAINIYDNTAKSLGYKKEREHSWVWNWYKTLQ
ncbi:MAG: hypothetical protein ACP5OA_01450 [Candidatus Woesearchaeota archaeon]